MDDGAEGYQNKDTMTKPIQEIDYNVTSEGYIRVALGTQNIRIVSLRDAQ